VSAAGAAGRLPGALQGKVLDNPSPPAELKVEHYMRDLLTHPVPEPGPPRLHMRAMDNLEFIRDTMERAGSFTAVPGIGMIAVGTSAVAAAVLAPTLPSDPGWLGTWLIEAVISISVTIAAITLKARRSGMSLVSAPSRKFALALSPPLLVGAILTIALVRAGAPQILPGMWLLLYGTGVVTGGAFSVRIVPIMGICFLVAGTAALFVPVAMTNLIMAGAFGGLHILFGIQIARRHGG
jgi:hypothetical protein